MGRHLDVRYEFSASCPPGYTFEHEKCKLRFPFFNVPSSISAGVIAVSVIVFVLIVVVFGVVFAYRNSVMIKAASAIFCYLILLFDALMAIGAITFALSPNGGKGVCLARPWFTGLGVVGVMSCLLAKTERIRKIFTSQKLQAKVISNKSLMRYVGILLGIELVLLLAYTIGDFSSSVLVEGDLDHAAAVRFDRSRVVRLRKQNDSQHARVRMYYHTVGLQRVDRDPGFVLAFQAARVVCLGSAYSSADRVHGNVRFLWFDNRLSNSQCSRCVQ